MLKRTLPYVALLGAFCARTHVQSDIRTVSYWNGWYEKGHKVGYLQTVVQTFPDRFRFERRGKLTTEMMGTVTTIQPNTVVNTDRKFALRDFTFTMSTTGHDFSVSGVVRGHKLQMTVTSGGQRQSSALDLDGPVYPLDALPYLIRSRGLQPRVNYEVVIFDPMIQKTSAAEITVLGSEKLVLRDTARNVARVTAKLFGVPHTIWIDSSGVVVREESPPGSAMVLEPAAVAMAARPEETPPDLMSMFAVPSSMKLDSPRQLKYLKLELGGIDPAEFLLEDETQQIVTVSPLTLVINPPGPPSAGPTLPLTADSASLRPTLAVQSDNPLIKRKAREIAAGSTDATRVARAIHDWVFTNVRQKGTPSMPSATDVLKTMEGDCNEHAVLYAALCRSLGIPCRICVGLVYRDGYFWYHAWNKVYLGPAATPRAGRGSAGAGWVPVDPTFGQFPIDATHIKLTEGEMDKQAQVLTVVGSLSVRIIESR